jgi:hypothetical protein
LDKNQGLIFPAASLAFYSRSQKVVTLQKVATLDFWRCILFEFVSREQLS